MTNKTNFAIKAMLTIMAVVFCSAFLQVLYNECIAKCFNLPLATIEQSLGFLLITCTTGFAVFLNNVAKR